MAIDLKIDVFEPVFCRMKERSDSLRNVKHFPRTGIEGWFKVEVVAVLGGKVKALQNKGPDLLLTDGTEVELKAATNFSKAWFVQSIKKYRAPSLFLGGREGHGILKAGPGDNFEVVGCEIFSDGSGEWIVGLVEPMRQAE